LFDHVTALTVFPEAAEAVPVIIRRGLETVATPVVDGCLIVKVGAVRLALSGTFQNESLTVVTPPPVGSLASAVAQVEPAAMTMNWVALDVTAAPVTDHEVVPVASG